MKASIKAQNLRIFIFFIAGSILWACQSSGKKKTSPDTPYLAMDGKKVYDMYCVACHGADGKMSFSGATDLSSSTMDLDTRILQITHGKGVMNTFKGILTEEEIENVAIYIEELRVSK